MKLLFLGSLCNDNVYNTSWSMNGNSIKYVDNGSVASILYGVCWNTWISCKTLPTSSRFLKLMVSSLVSALPSSIKVKSVK